jgi:opacity protein-like surface antigen
VRLSPSGNRLLYLGAGVSKDKVQGITHTVSRWKLNGSASSGATPPPLPPSSFFAFSDQGTEFAWGAGAQAHIGNIGGRLEYERFRIPNTDDARVFSLSVILSLL